MDGDGVEGPGEGGDGLVEEDGVLGDGEVGLWCVSRLPCAGWCETNLFCVQSIVEAETPHCLDVLEGQRSQEVSDVLDLFCDLILSKYVSLDNTSLLCLDDVADALGENGIAVVSAAVPGKEANEALS